MYSAQNEGKSVVAERFIRTLKTKIYKYITSISTNVFIDKLDETVNKYNNTYHNTIKMKLVGVKDNTYIEFWSRKKVIIKSLNLKLVIMLEYRNRKTFLLKDIFQIDYWSEEVFVIKKVKNAVP